MLPWPSSMCERMNHWNFSSSGGLADEDVFGNGVNITNFCDSGAVVFNNTVVDLIKSAQVSLSISTIYAAFFPGSLFNQVAGQAVGGLHPWLLYVPQARQHSHGPDQPEGQASREHQ